MLIEVELTGDLDAGLTPLHETLVSANAPPGTTLRRHEPRNQTYPLR
jgi:hypothetical protein